MLVGSRLRFFFFFLFFFFGIYKIVELCFELKKICIVYEVKKLSLKKKRAWFVGTVVLILRFRIDGSSLGFEYIGSCVCIEKQLININFLLYDYAFLYSTTSRLVFIQLFYGDMDVVAK